ncbi:MAG: glycosyltransferase family 4 protein [Singulisphaera sp.]|nr:glycosyltransferase family 4 protein [Singulisphaera sp.]
MSQRIVSIQHGDYREALQIIASGQTEPYFGMKYSVDLLEKFVENDQNLIISLTTVPYSIRRKRGELVGIPEPKLPRPIPGRVAEFLLARRILKKIREFRPTHVLLRTGRPAIVSQVLRYAKERGCNTLVVFANFLFNDNPRSRRVNREITALMNEPFVFRVGNHKWPATQSLVDSGLNPAKAVAWDWPGQRMARDYPIKELLPPPFHLVYAGSITVHKGVGDLIDAASILHARGVKSRFSILGSGGDFDALKEKAGSLPEGLIDFKGRLPNGEVFQFMRDATLVFVPSRHSFHEGLPLTLTEGLASRTPLIVSDHPVMVRAFQNNQGLLFFRASDPASLASVTQAVLEDPAEYRRLSETTADALDRVDCPFSFGDLLDEWKQTFANGQG